VKRTFAIAVAATMGLGLGLCNRLHAQAAQGIPASASPLRTRVAMVNLVQVLKNYTKFLQHQEYVKTQVNGINEKFKPGRTELINLSNQLKGDIKSVEEREGLESRARKLQSELKNEEEDANRRIAKMQGDAAVQFYREVEEAVKAFAQANDIELVMVYNDVSKDNAAEYYSMNNVTRKMGTGPLMPMHWDPRMDITMAVVQMLNNKIQ
jgi:Skp family chaperone for outer membrane proteins